jgi:hypothetical protein
VTQPIHLAKDLREFIESLNSHKVEFVIVGAHALAFHGHPRYTADLDILFRRSAENAARLQRAIQQFGFGSVGLAADDFLQPEQVVQLGHPPNRIDLLSSISGAEFDEVWSSRVEGRLDDVPVHFISRAALVKNKRATGRLQDLADLEALGEEP